MTDRLALDEQICFPLYAASRAMTAVYRPLLDRLGLTYPQYLVLLTLWERDGRSVSDLCRTLSLDSGTLSPLLKRLEAIGLVRRQRQSDDERRVGIYLTDSGAALRTQAQDIPDRMLCALGLAPEEVVALRETLLRVMDSLNTHRKEE